MLGAIVLASVAACSSSDRGTKPDAAALDDSPAVHEADLARALDARQAALERNLSGRAARWEDRARRAAGSVTPVRTYRTREGVFCREFIEIVQNEAANSRTQRTACRDTDGVWRIARR